ncbi:MAG: branched-chain amino acid transport system substrate-binding protein [Methylobacteriaceae bacterium]|nr:branched-chain amino acid transport system substrate-binding protein [Methylobacteriaceae bacterium]
MKTTHLCIVTALITLAAVPPATGQQRGVTATEIKLGQTMPYSGPVSAFSPLGKGEVGYFNMINEKGGINGRRINFISLDDGYVPPKTVEQTRRLVEQDEIAAIFSSLGTAHNTATAKYLQSKKVPQLFIGSGASKFGDPQQYPNLVAGVQASFRAEARVYARYTLAKNPQAKFAILAQNDDFGRDYVAGVRDVLGKDLDTRATVASYEVTDPTIESQIVNLKATGADVLIVGSTPKFAAQAIRRVYEVGWKPMFFLANVSIWVSSVMEPAGLEKGIGILSTAYVKDPNDPAWADDPGVKEYKRFLQKYVPDGDLRDQGFVNGYNSAMAMMQVLKQCGDDLSSDNILKQALNLKDIELPMLLPGIKVNTSPTDHLPVEQMQMMRFDGKQWVRFGEVLDARD